MQLILVHGYLAPAALLWPLGRRLARAGWDFRLFDYPSRFPPLDGHAERLAELIDAARGPVGLIGHSMGGLLVHRAVELLPQAQVEAQVFLATPHRGSALVRSFARVPGLRRYATGVAASAYGVAPGPPLGRRAAIAGTRDPMVRPHEGLLSQELPFLALPFGHNELVLRAETAAAIVRFLQSGGFD